MFGNMLKKILSDEIIKVIVELIIFSLKINRIEKLTVQKIGDDSSLNATRARPKSQIFTLQSAFTMIFFGFKSR